MKKIFQLLLILSCFQSFGQNFGNESFLHVSNVRNGGWDYQEGSIDSVLIEVKPNGLFAEVGVTMDFSTRGTSYNSNYDSLEIQMFFDLPNMYEVTDMWLWVGNQISIADVLDKYTANQIYEEIVQRRVDPAILFKYYTNNYWWDWNGNSNLINSDTCIAFKIFPLLPNLPRKAKFTMEVPILDFGKSNASLTLPIELFKLSNLPIHSFKIRVYDDENYGIPSFSQYSSTSPFVLIENTPSGDYYEGSITDIQALDLLKIQLQSQTISTYVGTFENVQTPEKFFEMKIDPQTIFNLQNQRKTIFMVDFDEGNCPSYSNEVVVEEILSLIENNYSDQDSIMIAISGTFTNFVGTNWIRTDSIGKAYCRQNFNPNLLNSSTNHPLLFADVDAIIDGNYNNLNAMLISSAGTPSNVNIQNGILSTTDFIHHVPVQIIDLNQENGYYYIGSTAYTGNNYFNTNLAVMSGGNVYSIDNNSLDVCLLGAQENSGAYLVDLEWIITLDSGYTFSTFQIGGSPISYLNKPINLVGKYFGTGDFQLVGHALSANGEYLSSQITIPMNQTEHLMQNVEEVWAGQYIRDLTRSGNTNLEILQIINTSIQKRVLSDYTAFLALDPNMSNSSTTPVDDHTDNQQGGPIDVNEILEENSLKLFPNPAIDQVFLDFNMIGKASIRIKILDVLGTVVKTEATKELNRGKASMLIRIDELPSGVYFVDIEVGGQETKRVKFVKI